MNLPTFKCRCSAISKIMSNSRSNPVLTEKQEIELKRLRDIQSEGLKELTVKQSADLVLLEEKERNGTKVVLSDSCRNYLIEWYCYEVMGYKSVEKEAVRDVMWLKKGRLVENDSIALLSVVDNKIYSKHEGRIANDYLTGEPDIVVGGLENAQKIIDIKSVWDYPGFLTKVALQEENNGYINQVQGYMDITGAPIGEVAYCLVDMPEVIRNDFKKKLFYSGDFVTEESPEFLELWHDLEHSMTFMSIPHELRVYKHPVEPFSHQERQKLYDRVKYCRDWLSEFHEKHIGMSRKEVSLIQNDAV